MSKTAEEILIECNRYKDGGVTYHVKGMIKAMEIFADQAVKAERERISEKLKYESPKDMPLPVHVVLDGIEKLRKELLNQTDE